MQEAEAASMNTESNIGSYMYDDNSNHQNTIIVPDILSYPECRISVPRRMYECYPLSTTSPEQLSPALFPPPPYSEVGDPATSNSSRYLVAIEISIFVTFLCYHLLTTNLEYIISLENSKAKLDLPKKP